MSQETSKIQNGQGIYRAGDILHRRVKHLHDYPAKMRVLSDREVNTFFSSLASNGHTKDRGIYVYMKVIEDQPSMPGGYIVGFVPTMLQEDYTICLGGRQLELFRE
jgi:hypothetical protein